jgi:hypothetical protein
MDQKSTKLEEVLAPNSPRRESTDDSGETAPVSPRRTSRSVSSTKFYSKESAAPILPRHSNSDSSILPEEIISSFRKNDDKREATDDKAIKRTFPRRQSNSLSPSDSKTVAKSDS